MTKLNNCSADCIFSNNNLCLLPKIEITKEGVCSRRFKYGEWSGPSD